MRLPGSSTPEPFPLSHHTLTTQPDHVPFSFTPGAPSGGLTTSHSTRQFIPHAGITGDGPSEEHPWAFIPTCSPVSIHLTNHHLSSPYPKGWFPPTAQSVSLCSLQAEPSGREAFLTSLLLPCFFASSLCFIGTSLCQLVFH